MIISILFFAFFFPMTNIKIKKKKKYIIILYRDFSKMTVILDSSVITLFLVSLSKSSGRREAAAIPPIFRALLFDDAPRTKRKIGRYIGGITLSDDCDSRQEFASAHGRADVAQTRTFGQVVAVLVYTHHGSIRLEKLCRSEINEAAPLVGRMQRYFSA
jgi:hypothetical protein